MSDTKPYKVLQAISFRSDRINIGAIIEATDEEANNIGVGEYLQPVDAQGAEATPEVETLKEETGHETPGDLTPPQTEEAPAGDPAKADQPDGQSPDVDTEPLKEEVPAESETEPAKVEEELAGETDDLKKEEEVA